MSKTVKRVGRVARRRTSRKIVRKTAGRRAAAKRGAVKSARSGGNSLNAEIRALLLEMVRGFASHMYMARQEVEQTRAILDDAATRLMPVFMACRRSVSDADDRASIVRYAMELKAITAKVLPAMQFHDLSGQLLAHTQDRFDTFLAELERLSRGVGAASEGLAEGQFAQRLESVRMALAENLAALDRRLRKPVDQANMASGAVELF